MSCLWGSVGVNTSTLSWQNYVKSRPRLTSQSDLAKLLVSLGLVIVIQISGWIKIIFFPSCPWDRILDLPQCFQKLEDFPNGLYKQLLCFQFLLALAHFELCWHNWPLIIVLSRRCFGSTPAKKINKKIHKI